MAKKAERSNFRVVVYPRDPGDYGWLVMGGKTRTEQEERAACEKIERAILRHVSKYEDDRGRTEIDCDVEFVCSHCGNPWTEESSTYNGGCCDADEANNPSADEAA